MRKITVLLLFLILFMVSCTTQETLDIEISFNSNGGTEINDFIYQNLNDTLPSPSKKGYKFEGWYFEASFTTKYEANLINDGDNLYAKWTPHTFNYTQNIDGNLDEVFYFKYDQSVDSIIIPEKKDHDFDGWYLDASYKTKLTDLNKPDRNVIIYGRFVKMAPTVVTVMYLYDGFMSEMKEEIALIEKEENVTFNFVKYNDLSKLDLNADIYQINYANMHEIKEKDFLMNLNDLYKNNEKAISFMSYDNDRYAVNMTLDIVTDLIFYDYELIKELGLEDPQSLYKEGKWEWNTFTNWTNKAKEALLESEKSYSVLGGVPSIWVTHLLPLNGTLFIDEEKSINFTNSKSIETYDFVKALYENGLFTSKAPLLEIKSIYGVNPIWNDNFSYVPFPSSTTYDGAYVSTSISNLGFGINKNLDGSKLSKITQLLDLYTSYLDRRDQNKASAIESVKMHESNDFTIYETIYKYKVTDYLYLLGQSLYESNDILGLINRYIKSEIELKDIKALESRYEAIING